MLKVQRQIPLYKQVYKHLKNAIITGELQPNERLVDSTIAKKLNVSRSPVREAFRQLENEGLIINRDGISTVYSPNLHDIIEVFQVRIGLESVAVSLATQLITEEGLDELSKSLDLTEQALRDNELKKVVELNTFFHEKIIEASGNRRLKKTIDGINTLTLLYRSKYFNPDYEGDNFLQEHRNILNAMIARNPEEAANSMKIHIENDMENLINKLSK